MIQCNDPSIVTADSSVSGGSAGVPSLGREFMAPVYNRSFGVANAGDKAALETVQLRCMQQILQEDFGRSGQHGSAQLGQAEPAVGDVSSITKSSHRLFHEKRLPSSH